MLFHEFIVENFRLSLLLALAFHLLVDGLVMI
jgi:hypothetical protein